MLLNYIECGSPVTNTDNRKTLNNCHMANSTNMKNNVDNGVAAF